MTNPRVVLATSMYEAGQSLRAAEVLRDFPDDASSGVHLLERMALECDVDADVGADRFLNRRGRLARLRAAAGADDAFAEAAGAWNDACEIAFSGNWPRFGRAAERTLMMLEACDSIDPRSSIVRARFLANAAISYLEAGAAQKAAECVASALSIAASRDDVPLSLRALIEANRACVFTASSQTLALARQQTQRALTIATVNAFPRAIWVCLYLRVSDNIWRGRYLAALDDALALRSFVELSDSRSWRDIAATRVSNAYSALERYAEAEDAIAAHQHAGSAYGFALQRCALTYRRGQYAQVITRSASIDSVWGGRSGQYHANGLLFTAAAAHRLNDGVRANADIRQAITLVETRAPVLYVAKQIYALAHTITGQTRFRDAASDLQRTFDRAPEAEPPASPLDRLTRRQREIADLAGQGRTNREIAARLGLSSRTVGNHLAAVFATLGVRARWQLRDRRPADDDRLMRAGQRVPDGGVAIGPIDPLAPDRRAT